MLFLTRLSSLLFSQQGSAAVTASHLTTRDKYTRHNWRLDDTEGPLRKRNKLEDLKEEVRI